MNNNLLRSCLLLAAAPLLHAADWPQYRGPNVDGSTAEKISTPWPATGPKQLWKSPTTDGLSSFTVSGGTAFTLILRAAEGAPRETLVALEAATGRELWAAPLGTMKTGDGGQDGAPNNNGGDGPRSTPSVAGGRVFVTSAKLVVASFDVKSGQPVWSRDLIKEHAGRNISWQNAASPLLEGKLVIVGGGGPGESLLALDQATGQPVWKAHDEKITHATPVAATILGQRQIIFFMQSGLVSLNPADGKLLWKHPFRYNVSTAASPVVGGDTVFCAAGYGVGATGVKITKEGDTLKATELWRTQGNHPVANHWSTPVHYQGHLYGMFSFKEYGTGPMKCVELATGKVKWQQPGFGAGQVILAGDSILALADNGDLAVVEASPAAFKVISRAKVLNGKCWSTPVLADGRVYARSTKEGVCLDVSSKTAQR